MASVMDDQRCQGGHAPSAWIEKGVFKIRDTGKPVPAFILEANKALQAGRRAEAEQWLAEENLDLAWQAAVADASRTDLMYMVASLLTELGRLDAADRWYLKILEVEPGPMVWSHLSALYERSNDRIHLALYYAQQTARAEPDDPVALRRLGGLLCGFGRHEEGIAVLKDVLRRYPHDPASWESLLWHLHYVPQGSREFFLDGYRQWGQLISQGICPRQFHRNDPDPDRRLRLGFISPDLRRNSAAASFEPFLDGSNRDTLEVHGYANVADPDDVTRRLQTKFDGFKNVYGLPPDRVAQIIEDDGIDVLVEIGGHVRHNGLRVLAYKPAPVQVDFQGISTTGLEQIGYRLTDRIIDPPEALRYYVEQAVYLAGGLACFVPPQSTPLVTRLPARANGFVTFGSFNSQLKIDDRMLSLWALILKANPGSRLVMKPHSGGDPTLRTHYLHTFQSLGVDPGRIAIYGPLPYFDYLQRIGQVDLALDAHPFNGCITTMEGLWMGVPIVTLTGDTFVSRMGLSILSRLGLEFFSAPSPEEYVAKASAFALQLDALEQIRSALRSRMLNSPLCDPRRWAREVEEAFRFMWRRWCRGQIQEMD